MLQKFTGEVQLVLYPFALNATSTIATQTALCAGEQGKFWEFHHMLYDRQAQWRRLLNPLDRLIEFAQPLDVDTAALRRCVKSGRMLKLVEADKAYGRSLQVRSTPTLFINNQRLVGSQPEPTMVRMIRQELDRVQPRTQ